MKVVYLDGNNFVRDDKTGYYLCSGIRKRLHRYLWEKEYGEIPEGYHIHHKDQDRDNNELRNLELIEAGEHISWHGKNASEETKERMRQNLIDNVRPKASEWHGSPAGRAWHRVHAVEVAKNRKPVEQVCRQCGKDYVGYRPGFCSNACKSAWRRDQETDNEKRKCKICGTKFEVNKYYKTRTCSRSCASTLSYQSRVS